MRALIGPSLRLQNVKLNLKSAGYGAAVEWHQDWAFYPYTNDDVLALGVMLDDFTPDNGPMMVLPGSHRGPVYDHIGNGVFCGAIDTQAAGIDLRAAVPLLGPAGSITLHHARIHRVVRVTFCCTKSRQATPGHWPVALLPIKILKSSANVCCAVKTRFSPA
jgi:hypothetical protein